MLIYEAALRGALYDILEKASIDSVSSIKGEDLEQTLVKLVQNIIDDKADGLYNLTAERLYPEQTIYYQNYALDKVYENIIRFSAEPLIAFSQVITSLWNNYSNNDYFSNLWTGLNGKLPVPYGLNSNLKLKNCVLDNGTEVSIVNNMHVKCKDEDVLKEVIRTIRAQWYATLSNLLNISVSDNEYVVKK